MNATMRIARTSSNHTGDYISIEIMSRDGKRSVIKIDMPPTDYAMLITGLTINVDLDIKGGFVNGQSQQ